MKQDQDIETLLAKYYEGESTLAEEQQLRAFFQNEALPSQWQAEAEAFRYFAATRQQQPSLGVSSRVVANLTSQTPVRALSRWGWRVAASVALLAGGFVGGMFYTNQRSLSGETAPTVTVKKVLAFEAMPRTSASERIQAVNASYSLAQTDQELTQLLINTLNFDENVNVRLAACQALLRLEEAPTVREALIQSLKIQTDPHVQIALIEALVALREQRAVAEMQRLAENQQALDVVRLKATEGLTQLARTGPESTT